MLWKLLIKLIILSFILILFLMTICMSLRVQNSSNFIKSILVDSHIKKYEVESNIYTYRDEYKNIVIEYPCLKADFSDQKVSEINDFIKAEAIKLCDGYDYVYEVKDYNYLELRINYEIEYLSDSYLSIVYKGLANPYWANHPTHLFYTLNIDLCSTKCIKLEDMIEINDRFLNLFKEQIENHKAEPYPDVDIYFAKIPDNQILKYLKSSDNLERGTESYYGVYSYFTDKEVCVVYPVPYAVGNHTVIKIDMDSLQ